MNKDAGMNKDVCAVILAGGKSSRMGRDKASLTLGNETFLQRIAAELDACGFQEKYVSLGSGNRYGTKKEEKVPDLGRKRRSGSRAAGPRSGTDTGTAAPWAASTQRFPFAARSGRCSSPATPGCTGMSKRPPSETDPDKGEPPAGLQLLIPVTPDGRWHMTCALWRKTLLPEVEAQLKSGDYRLRKLCLKDGGPSPGTVLVRLEGEQAAFAEMLNNINTEEDYRQMVVKNCRGS